MAELFVLPWIEQRISDIKHVKIEVIQGIIRLVRPQNFLKN